jgi:hypothetical protein
MLRCTSVAEVTNGRCMFPQRSEYKRLAPGANHSRSGIAEASIFDCFPKRADL